MKTTKLYDVQESDEQRVLVMLYQAGGVMGEIQFLEMLQVECGVALPFVMRAQMLEQGWIREEEHGQSKTVVTPTREGLARMVRLDKTDRSRDDDATATIEELYGPEQPLGDVISKYPIKYLQPTPTRMWALFNYYNKDKDGFVERLVAMIHAVKAARKLDSENGATPAVRSYRFDYGDTCTSPIDEVWKKVFGTLAPSPGLDVELLNGVHKRLGLDKDFPSNKAAIKKAINEMIVELQHLTELLSNAKN